MNKPKDSSDLIVGLDIGTSKIVAMVAEIKPEGGFDIIGYGSNELFKQDRMAPGFTVAGQSAEFRNFKITEATLNPEWEKVKATLPRGEKAPPAAAPARAGAGAKKGGKKKAE